MKKQLVLLEYFSISFVRVLFLMLFFSHMAAGQSDGPEGSMYEYQLIQDYSGLDDQLVNKEFDDTIINYLDFIDSLAPDASRGKVFGANYYPVGAFTEDAIVNNTFFSNFFDDWVSLLNFKSGKNSTTESPSGGYVLFARQYNHDRNSIMHHVKIKFPETSYFDIYSPIMLGALENKILMIMDGGDLAGVSIEKNAKKEAQALFYITQFLRGEVNIENPFEEAGFLVYDVPTGNKFSRNVSDALVNVTLPDNSKVLCFDYAGLKSDVAGEGMQLARGVLGGQVEMPGLESLASSLSYRLIITDDGSSIADMKAAKKAYTSATEKVITWVHYKVGSSIADKKVYVKAKSNYTYSESITIFNYYFLARLRLWLPEELFDRIYLSDGEKPIIAPSDNPVTGIPGIDVLKGNNSGGIESNCGWSPNWAHDCVLGSAEAYIDMNSPSAVKDILKFLAGGYAGLLDGLLGNIDGMYQIAKFGGTVWDNPGPFLYRAVAYTGFLFGNPGGISSNYWGSKTRTIYNFFNELDVDEAITKVIEFGKGIGDAIATEFQRIVSSSTELGYTFGGLLYEVVANSVSGGASNLLKGKKGLSKILHYAEMAKDAMGSGGARNIGKDMILAIESGAKKSVKATREFLVCKILGKGCFVAGTPVLAMGMIALPIQDIQPGQLVLANTWVNEAKTETACTSDTYFPEWKDPFTSDDQREIDEVALDAEQWYQVSMDMPHFDGTSSQITLLRPDSWLAQNAIHDTGDKIWLSMPEQNLEGFATVNSLAHYRFQKIPDDENLSDDLAVSPVTGIFVHESTDVWEICLDNGACLPAGQDTLGVTGSHPIYSLDANGWILASTLATGNQVLTKSGHATVTFVKKQSGSHKVYNLEVRDLHNFLVGRDGVVVHNLCWKEVADFFNMTLSDKRKMISGAYDAWYPAIFGRRSFLEGIMRKTKFKDWKHTYDLAKNYKAIDFYRKVNGKNIVASMKTTKLNDVQKWITQNKSHLDDLVLGKVNKKFDWGSNSIPADIVQLNLFTKKGLSSTERTIWKNAIKNYTDGKIQVIVEVIEESL